MRYVICRLNDENYTEPAIWFEDNAYKAARQARDCDDEWSDAETESVFEPIPMNKGKLLRVTHNFEGDAFLVTEVFSIPDDAKYIVSWHHAYDGVDFAVTPFNTREEAIAFIEAEVADEEDEDPDGEPYDGGNFHVIDTGSEWYYWEIIEVK